MVLLDLQVSDIFGYASSVKLGECSVEGCLNPRKSRGWCHAHYLRWRRHGDPLGGGIPRRIPSSPTCLVATCHLPTYSRDWCKSHYTRWWKYGDPTFLPPERVRQPQRDAVPRADPKESSILSFTDRLWSNVIITNSCWLWTGHTSSKGYGSLNLAGRTIGAHRASFELLVGPIPKGHVVHHVCEVRTCVCPNHLRAMTHAAHKRLHAELKRVRAGGLSVVPQ